MFSPSTHLRRLYRKLRPVRADPERFRMTLRDWLLYHQNEVVFQNCHWMGVRTWKNPLDAWILQEIVSEVRPGLVLEIGSAVGGSTLFVACLLEALGNGEVVSIDIDRSRYEAKHPRITTITGDSGSTEVVEQVAELARGKRVLVVHDGDHSEGPVLRDLRAYAPFVSPGSYFIVEDSIIDYFAEGDGIGSAAGGPLPAIEQFLRENPDFEVDASRERYVLTYNPRGFLRRVR